MLADVIQKISITNGPVTKQKEERNDKNAFSEILTSTMKRENGDRKETKVKEAVDKKAPDVTDEVEVVTPEEALENEKETVSNGDKVVMMNLFPEMKTENQLSLTTLEGKTITESVGETKSAVDKPSEEKNPLSELMGRSENELLSLKELTKEKDQRVIEIPKDQGEIISEANELVKESGKLPLEKNSLSELMGRRQNELLSLKERTNEKDQRVIDIPKDQGKIIFDESELVKETTGKPELFMEALKNAVSDEKSLQKESGKLSLEKEMSEKPEVSVTKVEVALKDALKEMAFTGKDLEVKLENREERKELKDFKEIYQALEVKEPVKDVTTTSEDGIKVEGSLLPMNEAKAVSNQAVSEKVSPKSFDFEKSFDNATEEIMRSMETIKEGGKTTMKVNLHPEEMGKMEITLTMEDGKLSGKILLDNREIRQIFTERLEELSNNLKQNSIQIGKFEVGVGDKGEGSQGRHESRQQMQNPFRGYFNRKNDNAIYQVSPERDLKEINLLA